MGLALDAFILELFIFLENTNNQSEAGKLHEIVDITVKCLRQNFCYYPKRGKHFKSFLVSFNRIEKCQTKQHFIGTESAFL